MAARDDTASDAVAEPSHGKHFETLEDVLPSLSRSPDAALALDTHNDALCSIVIVSTWPQPARHDRETRRLLRSTA
jgi:hypothetical protein